jgi:hypothetical protein
MAARPLLYSPETLFLYFWYSFLKRVTNARHNCSSDKNQEIHARREGKVLNELPL